MTKVVLPGSNTAGQPSGYAALDGAGGLLVPSYLDITEQGPPPANPAAGHSRLYLNSNHRLVTLDATGQFRPYGAYVGSGTAFPTTQLVVGDSFLRTDLGANGTLFTYTGVAALGTSGWIAETGPLSGGSGPLLARIERTTQAGPIAGETMMAWDATTGNTFTLTQQTRVQFVLRCKPAISIAGNVARMQAYCVSGTVAPASIPLTKTGLVALWDKYCASTSLNETCTFEADVVLAAGTWSMGLSISGASGGAQMSLLYEPNSPVPFSSTVLKALAIGTS